MRIIFLVLFFSLFIHKNQSQTYLDSKHYLIDSVALTSITTTELSLIDSCINQYYKEAVDTSKINAINTIVSESWNINVWPKYNDWILDFSTKKLKEEKEDKIINYYRLILSQCYNNKGFYLNNLDDKEAALEYYFKSLKLLRVLNDKENTAYLLLNIGSIYDDFGDLIKSLEYYDKALTTFIEIDNKLGIATAYNNLGAIYADLSDNTTAMSYYRKALRIYQNSLDEYNLAITYGNIGNVLFTEKKITEALSNYQKSLELSKKNKNYDGIGTNLSQKANCYFELKDYDSSLKLNLEALQIRDSINSKRGVAYTYVSLSKLYYETGKTRLAMSYGEKALIRAKKLGYPILISTSSKTLSKIYEKLNQSSKALELYKLYKKMEDSLKNEKVHKRKLEQEVSYIFEKKQELYKARVEKQQQKYNKEYNEKIKEEKQKKEKQKLISYFIASGLFIGSIFFIFIFIRLKESKKQKEIIEQQKEIVEQQKKIVENTHLELNSSIDYAKYLQDALLPDVKKLQQNFTDSFVLYKPKNIVSGDFYWFEYKNNVKYIAVADCTGHGVPGAMMSVVCSNALDRALNQYNLTSPSEIISKAKVIITKTLSHSGRNIKDGMDIILCAFEENKVYFSGAFSPFWIVRNKSKIDQFQKENCNLLSDTEDTIALIEYKGTRRHVGFSDEIKEYPFKEHSLILQPGDKIYLFTDGYADQFGGEKVKKFKHLAFKKLLLSINDLPMDEQKNEIDAVFEKWKGDLFQVDDVCVLGITY